MDIIPFSPLGLLFAWIALLGIPAAIFYYLRLYSPSALQSNVDMPEWSHCTIGWTARLDDAPGGCIVWKEAPDGMYFKMSGDIIPHVKYKHIEESR